MHAHMSNLLKQGVRACVVLLAVAFSPFTFKKKSIVTQKKKKKNYE
jgi:hypothetical protein